jgi:hypothetical protein
MKTDFDFPKAELIGPVAFRPNFNTAQETLNATQAWSLFFTGGQADNALGFSPEAGKFFNNLLIGLGVSGILLSALFLNGAA